MFCLIHKSSHVHSLWHIVLWDFLLPSHGGRKSTSSSAWGGKAIVSRICFWCQHKFPNREKKTNHPTPSPVKFTVKNLHKTCGNSFSWGTSSESRQTIGRMARWVVSFTMMAMQSGMSPWVLPLVPPGSTTSCGFSSLHKGCVWVSLVKEPINSLNIYMSLYGGVLLKNVGTNHSWFASFLYPFFQSCDTLLVKQIRLPLVGFQGAYALTHLRSSPFWLPGTWHSTMKRLVRNGHSTETFGGDFFVLLWFYFPMSGKMKYYWWKKSCTTWDV